MLLLTLFLGFLLGALTVVVAEALGLVFLIGRLSRRIKEKEAKAELQPSREIADLDTSYYNKQGLIWVLESEKVPKFVDKLPREKKWKKEILEVNPVRKHAKIKGQFLILTEADDSCKEIKLKGCAVVAVSATTLSSRKWAKRYPIKVESRNSTIYNGSKIVYIYLENSWEKESWCKALRLASCDDKEKLEWFAKLNLEFNHYLTTINTGHPSFMKPFVGLNTELMDRSAKFDGSSSKVRHFLKRLAKKASKGGAENKASWTSTLSREERKISERSSSFQDPVSSNVLVNNTPTGKVPNIPTEEKIAASSSKSSFAHSESKSHVSVSSDVDSDDKIVSEEGTLCVNLLISRLFFDAKNCTDIKKLMQVRIQRTLSNLRTPNFIGDVTCTDVNLGKLPPYVHGMRVVPSDMNEIWALEIDIEYSGGAVLDIETRLEVREPDFQKGIVDSNLESSSMGEVTSDLLEGFEYFGQQFEASESKVTVAELNDIGDFKQDGMKSCKSSNRVSPYASRWKSILNTIAKQVSQVPLSLEIRIVLLRGTLRLHVKPPPTDQLWFGFTSMPDIDFSLDSSVGEHKITSGHVALFLINRFKAAIRETLLLPNCESVCIPWMLADKDDWVPWTAAPYIWINNQEGVDHTTLHDLSGSQSSGTEVVGRGNNCNFSEDVHDGPSGSTHRSEPPSSSVICGSTSSVGVSDQSHLQEHRKPLLEPNAGTRNNNYNERGAENPECQSMLTLPEEQIQTMDGDDTKPKRMASTRARMLGLGKRMGEKLDEKRRHIEEKGRHIVERMRGP